MLGQRYCTAANMSRQRNCSLLVIGKGAESAVPKVVDDHEIDVAIMMQRVTLARSAKPSEGFQARIAPMEFAVKLAEDHYQRDLAGKTNEIDHPRKPEELPERLKEQPRKE